MNTREPAAKAVTRLRRADTVARFFREIPVPELGGAFQAPRALVNLN
jgi:hypothetical protein